MKCKKCNNANICLNHIKFPSLRGCTSGIPDRKVPTNADRIRSMSDDELAEWLHNICDFEKNEESYKSIYNLDTEREEEIRDSYGDLLKWLRSKVEQENKQ